jgi:XrtN system VIT domain protein
MENLENEKGRKPDKNLSYIGIFLIAICSLLLYFEGFETQNKDLNMIKVIITFTVAIFYFWYAFAQKELGFKRGLLARSLMIWSLFLVSCFTLNSTDIKIFGESILWLKIAIFFTIAANCAYAFLEDIKNKYLKQIIISLLCFSLVLWLYFTILLAPVYAFGLIGLILLGLGFHAFVPLLTVIVLSKILFIKEIKTYRNTIFISIGLPIVFVVCTIFFTNYQVNSLNKLKKDTQLSQTFDLPDWVKIAQKVKSGSLNEYFIKKELTNRESEFSENRDFFSSSNFGGEDRLHDPLFMISTLVTKKSNLTDEDRIAVLENNFDGRHQTEERLWSGSNLSVPSIKTSINLFPENRISYTEKVIYIHNSGENGSWTNQEALFTFYMPQGSTVTSLSLWIEGQEQKGYLTTKSKAEKAYKTIVGVENRDPAVIHWQEGNRVTLRVFPCNTGTDRIVKIGITAPMDYNAKENTLNYANVYFKGPKISETEEDITLVSSKPIDIEGDKFKFTKTINSTWVHRGDYENNWNLTCKAPNFEPAIFKFGENSYSLLPYQESFEKTEIKNIYLDLDQTWDKKTIEEILKSANQKPVFIYYDGLVKLSPENLDYYFDEISKNAFNLFPIATITEDSTSLLVTNKETNTPLLKNLSSIELFKVKNEKPIKTFVLEGISPYLKTLKELRLIRTQNGTLEDLKSVITEGKFKKNEENPELVVIESAGIKVEATKLPSQPSTNNDHIGRLFAYNSVLNSIGKSYFDLKTVENNLLKITANGNVVSPVSSLIVLEKAADYQRFDITKTDNGMPNASFKKAGAVPEPHEWALIILSVLFITYFLLKK